MKWKTRVIKNWLKEENISLADLNGEQLKELLTSKLLSNEESPVETLKNIIIMNWLMEAKLEYDRIVEEAEEDVR